MKKSKIIMIRKKVYAIVLMVSISFFALSCSSDDSVTIKVPSVSFISNSLEATFFQDGNSDTPTVNWNGNQGTFELDLLIPGLSIDQATGVLRWSKLLPHRDSYFLEVRAINSAGETITEVFLKNTLQGKFIGNYTILGDEPYFEVTFNTDGTAIIGVDNEDNLEFGSGTWTIDDPIITVNLEIGKDINRRNIKIEISNGNYLKRCLDNLGDRR